MSEGMTTDATEERGPTTMQFQAEVSRLLEIVAKSLYSHKEVFLRELVSNASDACDKLRYAALTRPELAADDPTYRITLSVDRKARTLTVADNGIGMDRQDLIDNLGTIARSGTLSFVNGLSGDAKKDMALIGQFGVGFYSAFMVADRVTVVSRKAGDSQGWRWESDGKGAFTVAEAEGAGRGTSVILHLAEGEDEYLDEVRLRRIVKTYSDHIAVPVMLAKAEGEPEQMNRAAALWTRPKSEITADEYKEFYHHVGHAYDDPWLTIHYRAEGVLEYTGLLFVPSVQPFDLFNPERKHHLKLYVRRVFVADEVEGLLPPYLRFLRGIVDSEDLPLNVSREMLQSNPMVSRIRQGLTKRVLSEIGRKAREDASSYATFWNSFGAVLKEGIYEDFENRDTLLELARFRSTAADGLVSLEDYLGRMKEGQDAIFVITGDDVESLSRSPQLEGFRAKGVEVLLLTDPVDEFWVTAVGKFKDKPFKSVTRGGADLGRIKGGEERKDEPAPEGMDELIALFKDALKDEVKDVRRSERLTDSPVCLVADENDMDMHLERLLRQHKQLQSTSKRILEINPGHPLVAGIAAVKDREQVRELAFLLLDQARIVEGEALPDPLAFARRMASALQRGLTPAS